MTASQVFDFSFVKTDISVETVARYFGGSRYTINEKTSARIHRCINAACKLVYPKATYTIFPVSSIIPGKEIVLEDGLRVLLPECFDAPGTQLIAAIIGTLGERLEKECRELAGNGEIYESTLFDAVGTVMLDLLSAKICAIIEKVGSKDGLVKGARFAPGIDGYPLEQQHLLFKIADNESVAVFLNSSAIMVPTKSISFFMVLTDTLGKKETKNKCGLCRLQNCQFRKVVIKDNF